MSELHSAKAPTHCPRTLGYDLSLRKMGLASTSGSALRREALSVERARLGKVLSIHFVRPGVRAPGDALLLDHGVA